MPLTLPPDAETLADAVALAVREGIARGDLAPEETYSVYRLADELGVSRSPVREALLRLAEAGLVEIARNRGFRVLVPTADDVAEIAALRLALEPPAVRAAAEQGSAEALAQVSTALERMRAAADADDEAAFWPADRDLHDLLLRAGGGRRTAAIVADLRATTALLGPPTTAAGRTLEQILAEHEPVVAAVLARDGASAETAMREHLTRTGALLVTALDSTSGTATPC
ncbi:GntR family transcriptional regulator [Nocardioides sp.]|uniref:GntR family transcriptional regulator n=1 Tax=Nocardioides sp. TaxID=35761 RepID=UPI0035129418